MIVPLLTSAYALPPAMTSGSEGTLGYLQAGLDESLLTAVVGGGVERRDLRLYGEIELALLRPFPLDGGVGVGASWMPHPALELGAKLPLRATRNAAFAAYAPAFELYALPGYAGERWAARLELGGLLTPVSFVVPSQTYRERVWDDAGAGWVPLSSASARVGMRGTWVAVRTEQQEVAFDLALGWIRHLGIDALIPPVYATVGVRRSGVRRHTAVSPGA